MAIIDQMVEEARGLALGARGKGLGLRMIGGLAIRATCPSSALAPFLRQPGDADFVSTGKSAAVEAYVASMGWKPDREFNLYNGETRLLFSSPAGIKTDVFVGTFRMCHVVPFGGRFFPDECTLPLAELLLTKLQVVEANKKDLSDAACILADHEAGESDGELVNLSRLAAICGADWGLWKTVLTGLDKVRVWARSEVRDMACLASIESRAARIADRLHTEPKSLSWKIRARIGENLPWYETPEEVDR